MTRRRTLLRGAGDGHSCVAPLRWESHRSFTKEEASSGPSRFGCCFAFWVGGSALRRCCSSRSWAPDVIGMRPRSPRPRRQLRCPAATITESKRPPRSRTRGSGRTSRAGRGRNGCNNWRGVAAGFDATARTHTSAGIAATATTA